MYIYIYLITNSKEEIFFRILITNLLVTFRKIYTHTHTHLLIHSKLIKVTKYTIYRKIETTHVTVD